MPDSLTGAAMAIDEKPMRTRVEEYIRSLQDEIVTSLEQLDPSAPKFRRDYWLRPQGGGNGQSCIFPPTTTTADTTTVSNSVLEKAGVNISIVHGDLPPRAIAQMRADHSSMPAHNSGGLPFFAAGLSLVIHPRNPHAPTIHANYRYFEVTEPPSVPDSPSSSSSSQSSTPPPKVLAWWFGGGSDLTPNYLYEEDAIHFHSTLKQACDEHGSPNIFYPTLKKWCDEYFYIPHRGECRGVGGVFFDDLNDQATHIRFPKVEEQDELQRPLSANDLFAFIQTLGNAFLPSYIPIISRRHLTPYTAHERRWQLIRRGRYVEFNLIYDRGTKFGLMTPGARIESILMTLPETVRWEYMSEMGEDANSEEGKLMAVLTAPRDWV